jgi:glycine oxidase
LASSTTSGRFAIIIITGGSMPEVVVIGGGVMGLGAARELRRRGFAQVCLIERGQTGRGASWASAGIIGATEREESDPRLELRRVSRELWPTFAAELAEGSGLDPEYRETGCLFVARDQEELDWLRRRGTPLQGAELRDLEPALGPAALGGLPRAGGSVDPRRLARALDLAARRMGVEVRTGVEVRGLKAAGDAVVGVDTSEGPVDAELVVIAAGAWSSTLAGCQSRPPVSPQRGQILALDQSDVGLRHVLLTPTDPYLVPRPDGRLVIGATREEAGWDACLTAGGVAWLLTSAMSLVPGLRDCPILELWTGFRPLSADGLPLIGPGDLRGLWYLTGHGPSGIAPLPGSLALLGALVTSQPPLVDPTPFHPARFSAT